MQARLSRYKKLVVEFPAQMKQRYQAWKNPKARGRNTRPRDRAVGDSLMDFKLYNLAVKKYILETGRPFEHVVKETRKGSNVPLLRYENPAGVSDERLELQKFELEYFEKEHTYWSRRDSWCTKEHIEYDNYNKERNKERLTLERRLRGPLWLAFFPQKSDGWLSRLRRPNSSAKLLKIPKTITWSEGWPITLLPPIAFVATIYMCIFC